MFNGQLLVAKDVLYALKEGSSPAAAISGWSEINELADGAIAVFDGNNNLVGTSSPSFSDDQEFYIVVGNANSSNKITKSKRVHRKSVKYRTGTYKAPVKSVTHIGYNGSSGSLNLPTLSDNVGKSVTIRISKQNQPIENDKLKFTFDTVIKTSDTESAIVDRLISLMNSHSVFDATCAKVGTSAPFGISITAANAEDIFVVGGDNLAESADVFYTTKGDIGRGTPALLTQYEEYVSAYDGNTSRVVYADKMFTQGTSINSAGTYDTYIFEWETPRVMGGQPQVTSSQQLLVAIPESATTITQANLEGIFTAAVNIATNPVESGADTAI